MNEESVMTPEPRRRVVRPVAAFAAVILAAIGVGALSTSAATAETPANIALASGEHAPEVSVSYVPSWNSAAALNDGRSAPTDDLGSMWGTWGATPTPAADTATYTWSSPVTVSSTTVYLWQNDGVQDGGVMIPSAWSIDYQDSAGEWKPVTGSSLAYPLPAFDSTAPKTSLEPVSASFDAVTTRAVRLTLQRQVSGGEARATSVIEWQVDGIPASDDPAPGTGGDAVAVQDVAVRTITGTAPNLPERVWVSPENGPLRDVDATWAPVPASSYAQAGSFEVAGTVAGDDAVTVKATVYVADRLSGQISSVDYTSVVTGPGVAPVLPRTVLARYDDGTAASDVAVTWSSVAPAEYATAESVFDVAGAIASFGPGAVATVFVVAPANQTTPVVTVSFDSSPAGSGWFLETPKATVTAQPTRADIASVEISLDGGATWSAYTDPVPVGVEGEVDVQARATATDGAVGSATAQARIDTRAPVTTATIDVVDGTSATVTLIAADGDRGSGASRTVWSDGPDADPAGPTNNMFATYEKPFSVELTQAPRYVHVRTQDVAGNEEQTQTILLPARAVQPSPEPTPEPTPSPTSSGGTGTAPTSSPSATPGGAASTGTGSLAITGAHDPSIGLLVAAPAVILGGLLVMLVRMRRRVAAGRSDDDRD
ncbi:MAG: Ig domain protein [Microbacterium sp.]|jgi:hypothetical protein|nr:Ig domain protein [Microbacterium sp.]